MSRQNRESAQPSVLVLLATFNGEKYITAQLDSILASEGVVVHILVRDDGSSDSTREIVRSYADRAVTLVPKPKSDLRRGHLANFSGLCDYALNHSQAMYYAFADQDDVWMPHKLKCMVDEIKKLELEFKGQQASTPLLVHSDLEVVDERLSPIAPSFWRYQGLPNPALHTSRQFMYQNVVTGCATLFNRTLLEAATPLPATALVHDYWFALVAENQGRIKFIDTPLIKYRQHGGNAIGAKAPINQIPYFTKNFWLNLRQYPFNFIKAQGQVGALIELYGADSYYSDFSRLHEQSFLSRISSGHQLLNTENKSWKEKLFLTLVFSALPFLRKKYAKVT